MTTSIGYIKSQNLGGVMVWHIGGDDITGECGKKQGLLKLINEEFNNVKQTRGIIPKIDIRHDESVQLLLL
ncbi:hypothetical protein NQ317_005966 [Molorchus minor]|uniref:GH18 domain-containing protein n=1 Tax=Molorchus minor TaxID=1323400 RepID=A0ABQ9IVP5_9CUCU|nr:hypothetical protein NQ317_005966 [Molorchus minor]